MKGGLSGQVLHDHGKTILEFIPGPVKIKDGLFLGDELAARVKSILYRILNSS